MLYPKLNEIPCDREMTSVFGGYNHKLRIADGEFYDMENLSSDHYPVLSTRQKRGQLRNLEKKITGMIAKDRIYYLAGGNLYALQGDGNDELIAELGLEGDEMRTLVSMGARIVILPDNKYVNTVPDSSGKYEHNDIQTSYTFEELDYETNPDGTQTSWMAVISCDENGEFVYDHAPESPAEGDKYCDGEKTYEYRNRVWVEITSCFKLFFESMDKEIIDKTFEKGCYVNITNAYLPLRNGITMVTHVGENFVVFVGATFSHMNTGGLTATRGGDPKGDLVIEANNRLWSCKCGRDSDENFVNAISATMLGDFRTWELLEGTAMDSYAVDVGSDGAFTGAINYAGKPTFFKDNCMHVVYGDYPANYSLQTITCDGVQAGCDKSLVIIDSVLYYKSRRGIFAYDGSLPVLVSEPLGDMSFYEDGVACGIGQKYYISLRDTQTGKRVMFVLDTARALWHKEDGSEVTQFCAYKGDVYYLTEDCNTQIFTLLGGGTKDASSVKWSAESGIIGVDDPDKKYVSRMDVRMSLEIGAKARFYIEYDSCGEWEFLFTMTGTSLRSFSIPIRPQRCDHFRLKIEGEGDMKLFSLCKNVERGSNV